MSGKNWEKCFFYLFFVLDRQKFVSFLDHGVTDANTIREKYKFLLINLTSAWVWAEVFFLAIALVPGDLAISDKKCFFTDRTRSWGV